MRYFVIPDIHGNHDLARRVMHQAEIPFHPTERRAEGITVVQLGDLVNCVKSSVKEDIHALRLATEWFDVVLMGNHEYPYFVPSVVFGGFYYNFEVYEGLSKLERRGQLQPCFLAGDTLLTHAGVSACWNAVSAKQTEEKIRTLYRNRHGQGAAIITNIGYLRCGVGKETAERCKIPMEGGILWSDWNEPRSAINQVHGHTPNWVEGVRTRHDGLTFQICLDVGGGKESSSMVGLWLDESGAPGDIVKVTL